MIRYRMIFSVLIALVMACLIANRTEPEATEFELPPPIDSGGVVESSVVSSDTHNIGTNPSSRLVDTNLRLPLSGVRLSATPTPVPAGSEEARAPSQQMVDHISQLYEMNLLTTMEGEYQRLPDFNASWAMINYYDWYPTGHLLSDFVIRANIDWSSSSEVANWWNTGCGFVFRMNARGDHYLVFVGMDNWLYLYRRLDYSIDRIGKWNYGSLELPTGQAELVMIAEGDHLTFMVNDVQVGSFQEPKFSSGLLGYAIVSGTNEGFGTKCEMTDIELWEKEDH
ncbi:MAG: hypothetical protein GTO18_13155 [Anaerolineales bacterium]|nr:hypothetical protein [Anaerolineales bacterium]